MPILEGGAAIGAGVGAAALSSLINAGADIAGSIVKNRQSFKLTKKLMDKQQSINLANWNLQNAYNLPSAQMQRLKAAGLNPNLVYQNGGSFAGAGEISSPSVNQFDYQDPISNAASDAMSGFIGMANYDSIRAATENTRAAKELAEVSKALGEKDLNWRDRMLYQQYVGIQMKNLVDFSTAQNLEAKTGIARRDVDTYYLRLNNTLQNDEVQRMVGRAGIREIESHIAQINKLIQKTDSDIKLQQLAYARAAIAKSVEELVAEWKKGYSYVEKTDENGNVISSYHKRNLDRILENEMEKIEAEIIGQKVSNVSNPVKDIALGIAGTAAMLSGSKWFQKKKLIGFKK